MNKDNTKVQQQAQRQKSKYNIYVFVVCLFFSTSIWLLVKFSKDYEFNVKVSVNYINIPKDKFITKADTLINITLKVKGHKLLTRKFLKREQLTIDVNSVFLRNNNKKHFTGSIELKSVINDLMVNKFPYAESITDINPDKLNIEMDFAFNKKVAVKAPISYSLEKQHFLYGDIKVIPDSVIVYGPKSKIDKISFVEADSIVVNNLKETTEVFAELITNGNFNYHLSHKNIKVIFPVEKFTEMELNLPISLHKNNLENKIRIFPETAKITIIVALKDYNSITQDLFRVTLDTIDFNKKTSIPLIVEQFPKNIKISKIIPEQVEFIKLK